MDPAEVRTLLLAGLPGCDVQVSSDGSHYDVTVVGELFEGLRAVKRQQLIYSLLNEPIATGAIHAVHMHLFTPTEYRRQPA